jgi:hypothetical protein
MVWTIKTLKDRCRIDGEHWIWLGSATENGHPIAKINGKSTTVRRWVATESGKHPRKEAWAATVKCDRPMCVAPGCVIGRTLSDVMRDAYDDERRDMAAISRKIARTRGVLLGNFTEEDIRAIRASDDSLRTLAKKRGVCKTTIACIRRGDTWRHVPDVRNRSVFDMAAAL